ncbi:MAG: 4-demethylwyosine synthase TYW1 [Candidatus Diapherotrites archaeon]
MLPPASNAFKPQNKALSVFKPGVALSTPESHMPEAQVRLMRKQKYALFGHSAAKTCHYLKTSLEEGKNCYKFHFYGIQSHRCLQMSPVSVNCSQNCIYCWRSTNWQGSEMLEKFDEPEAIVGESLRAQKRLLSGFGGLVKEGRVEKKKWEESLSPKHVAISLTGEPTLYPKLGELIRLYHEKHMTTFLVSNGLQPEALKNLKELPTQLYVSIDSPNQKTHLELNRPLVENSWEKLMETLELFPSLKCRKVLRITCVKGYNMDSEKEFAALIKKARPDFVEVKGYSWVGLSRQKLKEENVPMHSEIKAFAERINSFLPNYKFGGEFEDSRVLMLWNCSTPQKIDFESFFQERGV